MEAKYYMGLDVGTQSLRLVVADMSGNIIASAEEAYPTYHPAPGMVEQKPEEWKAAFNRAMERVCSSLSLGVRYSIVAMSVDTTSPTVVAVDEEGEALMDAIMWMDVRAQEEADLINATGHPILKYVGGSHSAEWTLPKILWIKRHLPEIYEKSYKLIEQLDWFNHMLTGKFATSINQATCKYNYVVTEGGFDDGFFNEIGFSDYKEKMVMDVKRLAEPIGKIRPELAKKYDLNPNLLVVQGGIDGHVSVLGMGVSKPGRMALSMGTSFCQFLFIDGDKQEYEGIWGPYVEPVIPGLRLLEGGQNSAGGLVKWFMSVFGMADHEDPYSEMGAMIKDKQPGANGLTVLDFFQGNRTPYKDSKAKGAISGLTMAHTKADIYQAILESVAFGNRNIIETLERQGVVIEDIVGCGGVTKDPVFVQIISDVAQKPIIVTREPSAAALGCAVIAAVGNGDYAGFDEATRGMVRDAYIVEPDPAKAEAYDKAFERYKKLYYDLYGKREI